MTLPVTTLRAKGQILESQSYSVAAGGSIVVDPNFLTRAMRDMAAPEIAEITCEFKGNCTATGGAVAAADAHKVVERLRFRDGGGYIIDLPGCALKLVDQMERGAAHEEGAAIVEDATDAAYTFKHILNFEPRHSFRPKDFRVPLAHWLAGGSLELRFQAPTNLVINSMSVVFYVRIVDNRHRELKSRMVWKERSVTDIEDTYRVDGSLRAAFATSEIASGYTSLAGYTTVDVDDLDLKSFPQSMLTYEYRRDRADFAAADQFIGNGAIPLVVPNRNQRIGSMQDLRTFHLDFKAAAPTGGRVVICAIEDRSATLGADWVGAANIAELGQRIHKDGRVVGGGRSKKASHFGTKLLRRFAIRL